MSALRPYQICARCVLDTSVEDIEFDGHGICNYCRTYDNETSKHWYPNDVGASLLGQKAEQIKAAGRGKGGTAGGGAKRGTARKKSGR